MSNPCRRREKAGFAFSTLSVPIFGGVLCYFGQVGWGIALIVLEISFLSYLSGLHMGENKIWL